MDSTTRIKELLVKHWKGELSPTESSELLEWAGTSHLHKQLFQSFDDFEATTQEALEMEMNKKPVWENILKAVPELKVRRFPAFGRIAAAAAIIIMLVGGYLFYQTSVRPADTKTEVANTLTPVNHNRATLTKSDGSIVALDSLQIGTTLLDGGAKIIKKQNGQVVYIPGEEEIVAYNTITTPAGSIQEVQLADGSIIYLNALSTVSFQTSFKGQKIRNVLLSGEAYFEVAHNKQQPFIVTVDSMKLTVLGTEFNINSYSEEHQVKSTLFSGGARITGKEFSLTLTPKQQLQYDRATNDVFIVEADLEAVAAWKHRTFNLENVDTKTLLREICRWHALELVFPYGDPPDVTLSGSISRDTELSDLIKILNAGGIQCSLNGKKLFVTK